MVTASSFNLVERIGYMIHSVEDDVHNGIPPKLEIAGSCKRKFDNERAMFVHHRHRGRTVRLMSRSSKESKTFMIYLKLLVLIRKNIQGNVLANKRDLYYQDVELFESQETVDRAIATIAATFHVPRSELHVTATSTGMVSGKVTIFCRDGTIVEVGEERASAIPSASDITSVRINGPVEYILVVEKDAVFAHVIAKNAICITGKGYPDVSTRRLVHLLDISYFKIPIYALVDSDPDGIQILSCYKFGSPTMAIENHSLVSPRIRFLGVSILDYERGWMTMTARDFQVSRNLLLQPWMNRSDTKDWKREIQLGMFLQKKAELNVVRESALIQDYVRIKVWNS